MRSFILISFIYNLNIQNKNNVSPEIHVELSGKRRVFSGIISVLLISQTQYLKQYKDTNCYNCTVLIVSLNKSMA